MSAAALLPKDDEWNVEERDREGRRSRGEKRARKGESEDDGEGERRGRGGRGGGGGGGGLGEKERKEKEEKSKPEGGRKLRSPPLAKKTSTQISPLSSTSSLMSSNSSSSFPLPIFSLLPDDNGTGNKGEVIMGNTNNILDTLEDPTPSTTTTSNNNYINSNGNKVTPPPKEDQASQQPKGVLKSENNSGSLKNVVSSNSIPYPTTNAEKNYNINTQNSNSNTAATAARTVRFAMFADEEKSNLVSPTVSPKVSGSSDVLSNIPSQSAADVAAAGGAFGIVGEGGIEGGGGGRGSNLLISLQGTTHYGMNRMRGTGGRGVLGSAMDVEKEILAVNATTQMDTPFLKMDFMNDLI